MKKIIYSLLCMTAMGSATMAMEESKESKAAQLAVWRAESAKNSAVRAAKQRLIDNFNELSDKIGSELAGQSYQGVIPESVMTAIFKKIDNFVKQGGVIIPDHLDAFGELAQYSQLGNIIEDALQNKLDSTSFKNLKYLKKIEEVGGKKKLIIEDSFAKLKEDLYNYYNKLAQSKKQMDSFLEEINAIHGPHMDDIAANASTGQFPESFVTALFAKISDLVKPNGVWSPEKLKTLGALAQNMRLTEALEDSLRESPDSSKFQELTRNSKIENRKFLEFPNTFEKLNQKLFEYHQGLKQQMNSEMNSGK